MSTDNDTVRIVRIQFCNDIAGGQHLSVPQGNIGLLLLYYSSETAELLYKVLTAQTGFLGSRYTRTEFALLLNVFHTGVCIKGGTGSQGNGVGPSDVSSASAPTGSKHTCQYGK